jgi:tetratricopeptide (TPR) repeat protein
MANKDSEEAKPKRFRIAFSFAGEKREFVAKVARILANRFGEDKILYDKFHEAEFAVFNLGIRLPKLYGEESELIVPVICPNYDEKRWTGWEWVHIYGLLTKADGHRVMPSRFEYAQADGLSPASGFIELNNKTPEEFATLILERLAINEGFPKDHYTKPIVASGDTPRTSIPHNLPSLQPFFGRADELRKIADALDPKQRSWGTLIDGDGGRGKTSLAVFAAYQVPAENFERIVFVSIKQQQQDDTRLRDLGSFGFDSWIEMLGEISRILDLKAVTQASETQRARILSQLLEGRRILLVLDNLETLSDAEQDQLFGFLDRLPFGNKALLTSRRFVGTTVHALDLPVLDQSTALRLLQEIAAHNTAFAASSESDRIDLIRQTQGNALLLRWTAGQVGRGRCRNIVDALDYLRSCPKDNNPLEFIFGDIFASLSEPDIALLAALSYVSQPMRREDLIIISGVAEEDASLRLKELINRSVITSDVHEALFMLVPLVAYFLRLKEPDALRATGDRLERCAYLLVLENGFTEYDRFPVLDSAWPTVAGALPRFLAGDNDRFQNVVNALRFFLEFTGRFDESLALSRDAEIKAVAAEDFLNAGWCAQNAGYFYSKRRESALVLACSDRAEAHWLKAKAGAREHAFALHLRGIGHELARDYAAAIVAYRQAVELHRTLDRETPDVASALSTLADAESASGDFKTADGDYREALRIALQVGHREMIAGITGNLASLAVDQKDWLGAEALARDALPLSERVGRLDLIAADCYHLAAALLRQEKKEQAIPYAKRAVEIYSKLGSPYLAHAQQVLAECES